MLSKAIAIALSAHENTLDKKGCLYIYHPFRVADMARFCGLDEECQEIAVLHDVVEDTNISLSTIRYNFGCRVADGVDSLTRRNKKNSVKKVFVNPIMGFWDDLVIEETYEEFVSRACLNPDACRIKPLDNADNMRPDRAVEGLKLGGRYKECIKNCRAACEGFGFQDFLQKFDELVTWVK